MAAAFDLAALAVGEEVEMAVAKRAHAFPVIPLR